MANSEHPNTIQATLGEVDVAAPAAAVQVGGRALTALPTYHTGDLVPTTHTVGGEAYITSEAHGIPDDAAPTDRHIVAFVAETTVPVAVTADGDVVDLWVDTVGRLVLKGYIPASDTLGITDVNPAKTAKMGSVPFAQLVAAGSTTETNIRPYSNFTFSILIAAINTSVTVRVEGSLDGIVNWFNLDDTGADTTYTTNGLKQLSKSNVAVEYVRFTFVSEVGGAAATLDVDLMAGN